MDKLSINEEDSINHDEPIKFYFYNGKKYIRFIDKHGPKPPHFEKDFKHKPPPPPRYNFIDKSALLSFDLADNPPFNNFKENIILVDELDEDTFKYFWCLVLFIIDILLIWFFIFLRKKLKPILILKENMIKLSKGDFSISMKTNQKDEISQVSNEFDNAIKQLRQLRESRNLFLRNIMHELKTPITKGKLITDMYDDCERKFILIRVFQRLEYLLSEFAKIEELTSGKINLKK